MITTSRDLASVVKQQYSDTAKTEAGRSDALRKEILRKESLKEIAREEAVKKTSQSPEAEAPVKTDGVVMTILNTTRRKMDYMERSMINEDSQGLDRNSLLQTMTQLSVKANDGSVSAANRRELRQEINAIMSDLSKMNTSLVKTASENILSDANQAIMAQANQTNENVMNLLV